MSCRRARRVAVTVWAPVLMALGVAACSSSGAPPPPAQTPTTTRSVYVAIGDGVSTGEGTTDRLHNAWTQLFFRDTLPATTTFVDFALPGDDASAARTDQVPDAAALHPTLATVALFDDAAEGTPVQTYARDLQAVVASLRGAGAAVLLADVPPIAGVHPAVVAAYDHAIDDVARTTGATVVALEPLFSGSDPLTPDRIDDEASARIADAFAGAWRTHRASGTPPSTARGASAQPAP